MSDPVAPWRGLCPALIPVRVTPRARREGFALTTGDDGAPMLRVHVRAVPEDGRANAAVCALLAAALGVPKSALSVAHGATSRMKLIRVA